MSYEFLDNNELIHEIDILSKQTETLASQAEKLARLKAEGRVGDAAHREVFEDLRRRAEVVRRKKEELLQAAEGRVKQLGDEASQLKHQLEILEVRHTIGAMAEERYKVVKQGIEAELGELEDTQRKIQEFVSIITESSRRADQYVSGAVEIPRAAPTAQPAVTRPAPAPAPAQPKPEAAPKPAEPQKARVKKCGKCGAENLETATYCYNCGAKL